MAGKTVAQKGHLKPGTKVALVNRVPAVVESIGLPSDVAFVKPRDAQVVLLFAGKRAELDRLMPSTVADMASGAALWVFFRKGSKDAGLDMNRDTVWGVAERLGMRPLGIVAVDEAWAAFRLRAGEPKAPRRKG